MKKIHLLFFSTLLLCTLVKAQKTVSFSGTVIDSDAHKPLPLVTVAVQLADKHTMVKTGLTDDKGHFALTVPAAVAGYRLLLGHVGYTPLDRPAPPAGGDMGEIVLAAKGDALQNVTVTASRPLIKQEIDRLSYDVQADPQTKGQTVMDMLRRVPLITVDGDDNIQLQGSGAYRIFINGKPSALVANNPKDVLRAMPATAIQKIEVITTPPAKYDAEGLAGIINIITVKKAADGYNGTISLRGNSAYGGGLNLTGTAKKGSLGISFFGGGSLRPDLTIPQDNIRKSYINPDLLSQYAVQSSRGQFAYAGFESSLEFDSLHLLTASFNGALGPSRTAYDRSTSYAIPTGNEVQSYRVLSLTDAHFGSIDAGLNYQLGFAHQKERLLTASYRYSDSYNDVASAIDVMQRVHYDLPDSRQKNNSGYKEHTFQLDYVHPVKKLNIEGGAKIILRDNYSNSSVQNQDASLNYVDDPSRTNDFNYQQNIYSAYNSYSLKLDKWSFQAGLRAEHTTVHANFTATSTLLDMQYSNLVPTLSILKTLKNNNTLTFGITNRLMRPGIQQLNPFTDKSNPQLVSMGNPDLRPVISHLFELSYNKIGKGSLNMRVSYMYTNNSVEQVTRVLSDTVSLTTFDNVGQNRVARFNINGNYPIGSKLTVNFNTGIFYVWISGTYNGRFYSNEGPRTNTFVNANYKINGVWQLGLSGGYNRRYINLQGSSNDYYYSTFSATCTLKKFTFTGAVNNPFAARYAFTQYTDTPDFYQANTSQLVYRTVNLNVSYRFGKLNTSIKKNKRGINNDDTQTSN